MPQVLVFADKKTGWLRSIFCEHKKRQRPPNAPVYGVAKRHAMFADEMTAAIRYPIHKKPVACAVCGAQRARKLWTMIVPFRAWDVDALQSHMTIDTSTGPVLAPLTPVCHEHPLFPDVEPMNEFCRGLHYFWEMQQQPKPAPPKRRKK